MSCWRNIPILASSSTIRIVALHGVSAAGGITSPGMEYSFLFMIGQRDDCLTPTREALRWAWPPQGRPLHFLSTHCDEPGPHKGGHYIFFLLITISITIATC